MTLEERLILLAQEICADIQRTNQRLSALEQHPPTSVNLPPADASAPERFVVQQSGEWRTASLSQMKRWLRRKNKKVIKIKVK